MIYLKSMVSGKNLEKSTKLLISYGGFSYNISLVCAAKADVITSL